MESKKRFSFRNLIIWLSAIPVCTAAIYCFYKGAMFSFEIGLDEFSKKHGADAARGGILVLGFIIILLFFMCIVNIIVHFVAGFKIIKHNNDIYLAKLLSFKKRKFSNIFLLIYSIWFLYGIVQSNIYYMLWCFLACIVTLYYQGCFSLQNE